MIGQQRHSANVLVVDDERPIRRLVSLLLKQAGARVSVAENGEAAYAQASAAWKSGDPFDVILMDLEMPVLDGLQATRKLRAEGYAGTIVAYTGSRAGNVRERCLRAGCDDYVNKLLGCQEIVKLVSHYLERRRFPETVPRSSAAEGFGQRANGM